jgi:hypothetical protein
MYRLVITLGNLEYITKNFKTKNQAEDFVLELSEKRNIKRADILNLENKVREKIF